MYTYTKLTFICRISKQRGTTNNTSKAKFINAKGVSNESYASEKAIDIIRGNREHNSKETEYYVVERNGEIGNHIKKGCRNQQAKPVNSAGYDLATRQMKAEKKSEDYDHLEHIGLTQRPHDEHDSNDTYAHVHNEGFDNNETYSHANSRQYLRTDSRACQQNDPIDNTYDHAKIVGYGGSDTYDHSHFTVIEVNAESVDYSNAHTQKTTADESKYDNAGCGYGNDNDTYE